MLSRELFYTAITRARKKLILLSDEETVARACANSQPILRKTLLPLRLREVFEVSSHSARGPWACGIIASHGRPRPDAAARASTMEIKKSYPDAILFFRLGDFYEMFFDDARTAAPILEVVLTSRNKNKEDAVPLCGVPHHAWENYAAKLLRKGFKVAICEQIEDPALAKGIVRREVTHILTPATALEVEALDPGLNNFIAVIRREGGAVALASMDLARLRFRGEGPSPPATTRRCSTSSTASSPRRSSSPGATRASSASSSGASPNSPASWSHVYDDAEFGALDCAEVLKKQFRLESIEGLGLDGPSGRGRRRRRDAQIPALHPPGAAGPHSRPALQRQRKITWSWTPSRSATWRSWPTCAAARPPARCSTPST